MLKKPFASALEHTNHYYKEVWLDSIGKQLDDESLLPMLEKLIKTAFIHGMHIHGMILNGQTQALGDLIGDGKPNEAHDHVMKMKEWVDDLQDLAERCPFFPFEADSDSTTHSLSE